MAALNAVNNRPKGPKKTADLRLPDRMGSTSRPTGVTDTTEPRQQRDPSRLAEYSNGWIVTVAGVVIVNIRSNRSKKTANLKLRDGRCPTNLGRT